MKYFDYMESTYARKTIANQVKYDAWTNAEAKAAHTLIGWQRVIYTYVHYFLLMFKFGAMILGITKPPQKADDFIKEYQAKEKEKVKPLAPTPQGSVTQIKPVS